METRGIQKVPSQMNRSTPKLPLTLTSSTRPFTINNNPLTMREFSNRVPRYLDRPSLQKRVPATTEVGKSNRAIRVPSSVQVARPTQRVPDTVLFPSARTTQVPASVAKPTTQSMKPPASVGFGGSNWTPKPPNVPNRVLTVSDL